MPIVSIFHLLCHTSSILLHGKSSSIIKIYQYVLNFKSKTSYTHRELEQISENVRENFVVITCYAAYSDIGLSRRSIELPYGTNVIIPNVTGIFKIVTVTK